MIMKTRLRKINLPLLCAAVYFSSYLTRQNYGVVLVEIIKSEGYAKTAAALPLTTMFITYGIGQLISGYLGDHVSPRRMISIGLVVSGVINLVMPLCKAALHMTFLWGMNGFAQSLFWPPIVKILAMYLPAPQYQKSVVRISWIAYLATIFLYVFSPIIIHSGGWRLVFTVCGLFGLIMACVWNIAVRSACNMGKGSFSAKEPAAESTDKKSTLVTLLGVGFATVLMGVVRDGMTSWFPMFVSEKYHLQNDISILSGVIVPAFSVAALVLTSYILQRWVHNELRCAAGIFLLAAVSCGFVKILFPARGILTAVFFAATIGCVQAVGMILTAAIPCRFAKSRYIALISGALNSATYVGSAISTYGVAVVSERFGWNGTLIAWISAAAAGALACAAMSPKWTRYT